MNTFIMIASIALIVFGAFSGLVYGLSLVPWRNFMNSVATMIVCVVISLLVVELIFAGVVVLLALFVSPWLWFLFLFSFVLPIAGYKWIKASIKEVRPNQLVLLIMWGEAIDVLDPGLHPVPWCFGWNRVQEFPTTMWDITYPDIKVVTAEGEYAINGGAKKKYGEALITVKAVGYLTLPKKREMVVVKDTGDFACFLCDLSDAQRIALEGDNDVTLTTPGKPDRIVILEKEHPIVKIWKSGTVLTKAGLLDFSTEAMTGAIRLAVSKITWPQANADFEGIKKCVEAGFRQDSDGALILAGFRPPNGIKIGIQEVILPEEITKQMARREAAENAVQADAREASVTPVAYNDWLETEVGKNATQSQKDEMLRILGKQALADDGNYKETRNDLTIKGLENATTVVIGEGGAALLAGGGGGGGGGRKRKSKKKDKRVGDMPDDEFDDVDED